MSYNPPNIERLEKPDDKCVRHLSPNSLSLNAYDINDSTSFFPSNHCMQTDIYESPYVNDDMVTDKDKSQRADNYYVNDFGDNSETIREEKIKEKEQQLEEREKLIRDKEQAMEQQGIKIHNWPWF